METPPPLVIPVDLRMLVFCLIGGLIVVALCGHIVASDPGDWEAMIVGSLGIAFFGGVACVAAVQIFGPSRALRLDADGLDDRVTVFGAGFLPWSAIQSVERVTYRGMPFVAITLHDPDAVRLKAGRFRRSIWSFNRALTPGDGVIINATMLRMNVNDIVREIELRRRAAQPHSSSTTGFTARVWHAIWGGARI